MNNFLLLPPKSSENQRTKESTGKTVLKRFLKFSGKHACNFTEHYRSRYSVEHT